MATKKKTKAEIDFDRRWAESSPPSPGYSESDARARERERRRTGSVKLPPGMRLAQCTPYFEKGLTDAEIARLVNLGRAQIWKMRQQWQAKRAAAVSS